MLLLHVCTFNKNHFVSTGKLGVKCNQTGKVYKVKTTSLLKENADPLSKEDLVEGTQLLLTMHNKSYPVTFQKVLSEVHENSELHGYYKMS